MKTEEIEAHMEAACGYARKLSKARRLKVCCLIVDPVTRSTISTGINGTPPGWSNECEVEIDGKLVTTDDVIHAEENATYKLARHNGKCEGAWAFCTHAPCKRCARALYMCGISTLVYGVLYASSTSDGREGLLFLERGGVRVIHSPCNP